MINQLSSIGSTICTSAVCFSAGYALNVGLLTINQIAAKQLKFPIDLFAGKSYEEFFKANVEECKNQAYFLNISLDRILGRAFLFSNFVAMHEEVVYRYFIETVALPKICSNFEEFSLGRTCISTLGFAAIHLMNPGVKEQLAGQFINTICLGMICSFAQHYFGSTGAIYLHMGYNTKGYMFTYNVSELKLKPIAKDFIDIWCISSLNAIGTPIYGIIMLLSKIKDCFT
ncbi:MAG: CPBP family intramembrane metalloprotease [Simkania sp.]|nr:CPBP family intramembrane metalloprotease [Simkania sp.]